MTEDLPPPELGYDPERGDLLGFNHDEVSILISAAVAQERERAAKVCDVMSHNYQGSAAEGYTPSEIMALCAAAIRKGKL